MISARLSRGVTLTGSCIPTNGCGPDSWDALSYAANCLGSILYSEASFLATYGLSAYIYSLMFLLSVTCCKPHGIQLSFLLNTTLITYSGLLPEYIRVQPVLI